MPFYVFAWIASFAFALVSVIGKLSAKYSIKNPWLFNFLWMFFSLCLTIPLAITNKVGIPTHWNSLILVAVFNTAFGILYIIGLSLLDISVFMPLLNLRTAFVAILGALFLGEILQPFQYLLVAYILVSGMIVTIDEKLSIRSFFRWPVAVAMLCTLSYTLMGIFTKRAIEKNGYWEVTLWMAIISQIFLLPTFFLFKNDIHKLNLKQIGTVFSMSLALFIGVITEIWAYKDNVVITSIITSLPISIVLAFIFSIFAPQLLEKHTLKVYAVRLIAAGTMIFAALKLSY